MHEHVDEPGAIRDRIGETDRPPVRDVPAEVDYPGCIAVVFGSRENPGLR